MLGLSTATINAALNRVGALLNGGKLKIYGGDRPKSLAAPLTKKNKLLFKGTFSKDAFAPARNGAMHNNWLPADRVALGTPTFWRAFDTSGRAILAGTVGDGPGDDMRLDTSGLPVGAGVAIEMTLSVPLSSTAARGA